MGCTLIIRQSLDRLTGTEVKLARYILEHCQDVIHMNTREFAEESGTSPAAVVRFSQKLGFKGFSELKLDLARENGEARIEDFQSVIHDGDGMDVIVRKAERAYTQTLTDTCRIINASMLDEVVGLLSSSRHIHLFGAGTSGLIALDFQDKLSRIGLPVFYHRDMHTNLAAAALMTPDEVCFAISYSGETRGTVLAAQSARRNGCKVVSITRPGRSRLTRVSDYPIFIPGEEQDLRVGAMTSRISTLLVLDLLYLGLARRDVTRTEACLKATRDMIQEFLGR